MKPLNRMTREEMRKVSSESPPRRSFGSLPDDVALNCLARISRIHYPTLSLVSKGFRSLLASPELNATRSCMGKTEDFLYVCLDASETLHKPKPRWFRLGPIPKQQRLRPIPSFPYQHPGSSTVVSIGSEIYIIGGFVKGKRSSQVLVLDCRSHQWRRLPEMRLPRVCAAADVIEGNIYVIGGRESNTIGDWGEIYDPKTETWEPLLPTTLDLTIQKSVFPSKLVMGGKVYNMNILKLYGETKVCLVPNMLCLVSVSHQKLFWNDPVEDLGWSRVQGLEELSRYRTFPNHPNSVANSGGGRRVTVWWKSVRPGHPCAKEHKTEIWCAEVSFERALGLR